MKQQRSQHRTTAAHKVQSRALYLIDIENMVGKSEISVSEVAMIRTRVHAAVGPAAGDHTVIATSHHNALAAFFGWRGSVQRLARSGKDGADTALLEVIEDAAWVASRYTRVVIASGDHAFAYAVAALKAAGCEVLVIRPDAGFSLQMRMAAGPDVVRLGAAIPSNVIPLFRISKDVV